MIRAALLTMLAVLAVGCARGPRSAQALSVAYEKALADGDAEAAYALLDPELAARTDKQAFIRRFEKNEAERKAALATLRKTPADERVAGRTLEIHYPGGRSLLLAQAGRRYVVVAGWPGHPRTDTPAAAVRALIAALRASAGLSVAGVASQELVETLANDWEVRANEIEAALREADALTVSADGSRAQLRYGAGGTVVLVQTPVGWRVSALE